MGIRATLSIICLIFLPAAVGAEQSAAGAGVAELPPRVRALLVEEMNAILDASQNILGALVRGDDALVAEQAQSIHDSFILKRKMTAADRQALAAAVPESFLERDREFHRLSAQLAAAARKGDRTRQRQLFSDMVDACIGCHSRHASQRFPAFSRLGE